MTDRLSARKLTLGYGAQPIIRGLSATIPTRRFTVLAGPNGSGKSTLLRALAGGLRPMAGEVALDGRPLSAWPPRRARGGSGCCPRPAGARGAAGADLVAHGRPPHRGLFARWPAADQAACDAARRQTGMTDLAEIPPDALSGGQRQRAWIAMALAQESATLLMDEPTAFLDLSHQLEVLRLIRDLVAAGRSVVAVLHDLNQAARHADHPMVLDRGRIVAEGAPEAALTPGMLRATFGVEVTQLADPDSGRPLFIPRLPG